MMDVWPLSCGVGLKSNHKMFGHSHYGRVISNGAEPIGEIRAVLAAAKPEETLRWRQLEHPVSHKIIQQGTAAFEIKPGDSLMHGERRYIIQTAPYNPGGLNHWTIYYCEERSDTHDGNQLPTDGG